MSNFTDNMIRDARTDEFPPVDYSNNPPFNPYKQQKIITFKGRDYLLFEGRIIDEKEADRIYTLYHEASQAAGDVQIDA